MVRLNNMQFRGYHGCLESEQRDGNWFRVDLAYDYPKISYAELTVTKFNPPLDGMVESSSVTVVYE